MKKIVFSAIVGIAGAVVSLAVLAGKVPYTIHAIINPACIIYLSESKVYSPSYTSAFVWTIIFNMIIFMMLGILLNFKGKYQVIKFLFVFYVALYVAFVVGVFIFETFIVR